jgi:hypothetical protein
MIACCLLSGQAQKGVKDLSAYEYELFKEIALSKSNYFYILMNQIANKSTPKDSLNYFLDEADRLFHDSAVMQIQQKNGKVFNKPIMEYLKTLSRLNYTELKIEVFSAYFVRDLHYVKATRIGNNTITEYEGSIVFYQHFVGKRGSEIVYSDTSEKSMRVHVLVTDSDIGRNFDVLLGDIKVSAIS